MSKTVPYGKSYSDLQQNVTRKRKHLFFYCTGFKKRGIRVKSMNFFGEMQKAPESRRGTHGRIDPGMMLKSAQPCGLNTSAARNEKMMAAEMPALVTSKMPVIMPMTPCSLSSANAP
ncbi:hypothetical protein SAMN04487970_100425 [Paenibacillus tianmuensis]|uniref:Uncharacterized protein n=1 Tax=Paenibacillus tianmuensis TaxID=624147 RepID=A0A1G4PTI2_9BACL|nr:hypothetical protein SAMN04487970_100425 [Paenibacillus tianmuensis]